MFRPRGRHMRRHHHRREGFALMLLLYQLFQVGFEHIPPTTLGTIILNVAIYLRFLNGAITSVFRKPLIRNICVSTDYVLYKGDWPRLLSAAWFHLDEWHLYYNMASFLWKGRQLETRFGTTYFAYLILVFSVLTNIVMVGVNIAAAELFADSSYLMSCAAGFSGVIFALKVLSTYYSPRETQMIMGFIPVPSRWACWIELVVIQILIPRASFTGHLAGILVGLAYVQGPLKLIMDFIANTVSAAVSRSPQHYDGGQSYDYRSGTTGYNQGAAYSETHRQNENNYNHYTGGMTEEEQLEEVMRRSRHEPTEPTAPPPYEYEDNTHGNYQNIYPDLRQAPGYNDPPPPYPEEDRMPSPTSSEELRRRRLARFDR